MNSCIVMISIIITGMIIPVRDPGPAQQSNCKQILTTNNDTTHIQTQTSYIFKSLQSSGGATCLTLQCNAGVQFKNGE